MKFNVITLFPKMFDSPFAESMIKRAKETGAIDLNLFNLRDWAIDSYGTVDDRPFGGDAGMLIRADVMYEALRAISNFQFPISKNKNKKIILLTPGGKMFSQKKAEELSKLEEITIICGHYEGFDQRIHDYMVDEELSIGRYILTGGELAAMVVIDSVTRLLPNVLGNNESIKHESYSAIKIGGRTNRVKEYPQYTRPREFMGMAVPPPLYQGDPKKIEEWKVNNRKSESPKNPKS